MRPKQWAKNVFLFAALVFSLKFNDAAAWAQTLQAFAAFCCVSSSGYLFNDARDVEADRKHPKKKFRPIAAGDLPISSAYILMVVLFIVGMGLAAVTSKWLLLVTGLYFVNTMSYSVVFKNIVILDIMFIAMGFLWRVIAGAVAIDVAISPWLIVCTVFLALFLGFNKRRGELLLVSGSDTRKSLKDYSTSLLQEFQAITTSGAILSYTLYTVEGPYNGLRIFANSAGYPWLLLTLPFVLYGVFRYIYLVSMLGEGGAPDETLLKDKPILLNGLLYTVTVVVLLILGN